MATPLSEIFKPSSQEALAPQADTRIDNPHDEIRLLRERLAEKERELERLGVEVPREQISDEIINDYKEQPIEHVLQPQVQMPEAEVEGIALKLSPEKHDDIIGELYGTLLERGIKNSLAVVAKMKNQHLEDDFHRFLVQYLQSQHTIPGLVNKSELYKALDMRLFEVTLPAPDGEGNGQSLKELTSMMEQFLAGMQSVSSGSYNVEKNYYALEMALSAESDEVIFYVCIPNSKVDLFEKQVLGLYDDAKIEEVFDDYNIFTENGVAVGSVAQPMYQDVLKIKTYDVLDHDPLKVMLNVFSKLDKDTEGVAIQIMVRPVGDRYIKEYGHMLDQLRKGVKLKDVHNESKRLSSAFFKATKEMVMGKFDSDKPDEQKAHNDDVISSVTEKMSSSVVETNIRIMASAPTEDRAKDILHDFESAFQQFNDTKGGGIKFENRKGSDLDTLFHNFSFRLFNDKDNFCLNLKEIASVYHFPVATDSSPQLKQAKSGIAPVPMEAPKSGILLGINKYRHKQTSVYMSREDRVRHMYVIGQTGTGKTSILKNMVVQDIRNGDGVCFIDPHGSDIEDILSLIPKERIDDVIYFDPAATARPMAFNMLEYDERYPEQKSFVIDEMLGIFNKLFDMKSSGGPMFEQYFRNATALVVEDPESGSTLLDVSRVLADENFRALKISKCKNPIVVQFWTEIAGKAGGEASLQNIVPYITSKFDVFLSNDIMRPIVSQQKSSFNFRKVMDEKKILLVNLSKGRLGEINANLLGLIMVGKILMAALSRVDAPKDQRPDFYLYIDEFQNVTTNSIAQILSEARKYRLSLNVAHQFIAQLDEEIKNAVFGNVGSMAVFRISSDDAQYLESRFKPTFTASDIMKIDNYNCYMSMLGNGSPMKPFNLATLPPEDGNMEIVSKIKELSFLKYGRPRDEVEAEIMEKYKKHKPEAPKNEFGF
jgi:hypothetical protein